MDDTDPGCPYCREIITGIEVIPDYVEVVQGESLPITVLEKYGDGQRNIVDQWTSNYNTKENRFADSNGGIWWLCCRYYRMGRGRP